MPRPTNKDELIKASRDNYAKLIQLIESYSDEDLKKNFPKGTLNRTVKDVVAHLHHWHLLMLNWYEVGMKGGKPEMPSSGYTWKTLPELNRKIKLQYQETSLTTALEKLTSSSNKVLSLISKHTNDQLFEKRLYAWTGSTSLASYLISNTSSHYAWAYRLIKKSKK